MYPQQLKYMCKSDEGVPKRAQDPPPMMTSIPLRTCGFQADFKNLPSYSLLEMPRGRLGLCYHVFCHLTFNDPGLSYRLDQPPKTRHKRRHEPYIDLS